MLKHNILELSLKVLLNKKNIYSMRLCAMDLMSCCFDIPEWEVFDVQSRSIRDRWATKKMAKIWAKNRTQTNGKRSRKR